MLNDQYAVCSHKDSLRKSQGQGQSLVNIKVKMCVIQRAREANQKTNPNLHKRFADPQTYPDPEHHYATQKRGSGPNQRNENQKVNPNLHPINATQKTDPELHHREADPRPGPNSCEFIRPNNRSCLYQPIVTLVVTNFASDWLNRSAIKDSETCDFRTLGSRAIFIDECMYCTVDWD